MKEVEIAGYILQHDARNLRLKRRLAERGIDWREQCKITCRFQGASQRQALRLAKELRGKGLAEVKVAGAGQRWRLEAGGRQSLEQAASHEFTEEMVRLAAAFACFYEGWEAQIAPEGA